MARRCRGRDYAPRRLWKFGVEHQTCEKLVAIPQALVERCYIALALLHALLHTCPWHLGERLAGHTRTGDRLYERSSVW